MIILQTNPFLKAKPILDHIENHHHQAYFVGGCVRDLLLKRPIGDIDITTSATPEFIQEIFTKVIPVGIEHGTVIVRYHKESYEVTTFRVEGAYSDKRHPDHVAFVDQVDKDLERRDFTMNALAMTKDGAMVDLFDGKKDLQEKIIRTVGNGSERFREDPLRIIRAIRFTSQLGFTIHPDTLTAIMDVKQDLESLAAERLTNEFTKLFAGTYVNNAIQYIAGTGIDKYLPIFKNHPDIIRLLPEDFPSLPDFSSVIALLHLIKPSVGVREWVKKWKCSNETLRNASQLVEAFNYYNHHGLDNWLVYKLNAANFQGFIRIIHALLSEKLSDKDLKEQETGLPITSRKELAVDGRDVINCFPDMAPGSWIQNMLETIESRIVLQEMNNTEDEIKEWMRWNPPEIS